MVLSENITIIFNVSSLSHENISSCQLSSEQLKASVGTNPRASRRMQLNKIQQFYKKIKLNLTIITHIMTQYNKAQANIC